MLELEDDLLVVGEAQSGETALVKLRETSADVVLMDVRLTGMSGIETLRKLKVFQPKVKVIMLTSYGDEYLGLSLEAGAAGYLLKRANRAELVAAIRQAAQGGAPLDSFVTPSLLEQLRNHSQHRNVPISPRETEVLQLVAAGHGNKEIAYTLSVSETTIKNHMSSILRKLDANDRTHAVTISLSKGWISFPDADGSDSGPDESGSFGEAAHRNGHLALSR